jgi:GNAT superfamily N-acetyltransferase
LNIKLININRNDSDLEKIRQLYLTAFPSDERAPFGLLVRKAKKPNINFFSCHDSETWIGFIYVINHIDLSYLYYFAVDDTKRGKGYGTAILEAARKKYAGRRLFLVIEEVEEKYSNYPQRIDRLHFYEHAGFVRTGQKVQEAKVIFDLMSTDGEISNKEYRSLIKTFMGLRILRYTMRILND